MLKRIAVVALFLLALLASSAGAQEPTSFLGAKFGVPLRDQYQECPKRPGQYGGYEYGHKTQCFERMTKDFARLMNPTDVGIGVLRMSLWLIEDIVEGASIDIYRPHWQKAVDLFAARYGRPHAEDISTFSNRAGMRLQGIIQAWNWPSASMRLSEYGEKIDESSAYVYTKRFDDAKKGGSRDNAEKFKDRL